MRKGDVEDKSLFGSKWGEWPQEFIENCRNFYKGVMGGFDMD